MADSHLDNHIPRSLRTGENRVRRLATIPEHPHSGLSSEIRVELEDSLRKPKRWLSVRLWKGTSPEHMEGTGVYLRLSIPQAQMMCAALIEGIKTPQVARDHLGRALPTQ